jgi:hypothetical protein
MAPGPDLRGPSWGLHIYPPPLAQTLAVCFFVLCNQHWFNKAPGPDPRGTELGVTYLPFAFSSDASCADLLLPLLGAPVSIGALVKLGCVLSVYF